MFHKRLLKLYCFEWRTLGGIKYIPFVVLYIFLPIFIYATSLKIERPDLLFSRIFPVVSFFIPICSCLWIQGILQRYVRMTSAELYYILRRNKLYVVLYSLVLYMILLVPLFWFLSTINTDLGKAFPAILVEVLLFCNASYFFTYLFQSAVLATGSLLLYAFMCCFVYDGEYFPVCYFYCRAFDWTMWNKVYVPLLLISLFLLILGYIFNRNFVERSMNR